MKIFVFFIVSMKQNPFFFNFSIFPGEYMCILKEHPNDPFVVFCVGITFIHMACQKFATKRHLLTIQVNFLKN